MIPSWEKYWKKTVRGIFKHLTAPPKSAMLPSICEAKAMGKGSRSSQGDMRSWMLNKKRGPEDQDNLRISNISNINYADNAFPGA